MSNAEKPQVNVLERIGEELESSMHLADFSPSSLRTLLRFTYMYKNIKTPSQIHAEDSNIFFTYKNPKNSGEIIRIIFLNNYRIIVRREKDGATTYETMCNVDTFDRVFQSGLVDGIIIK